MNYEGKKKGRDLTESYDKIPYMDRKIPKSNVKTQKRHQKLDYTAIADQLRTVSWGNDSHPTGVVKRVYGISFQVQTIFLIIKHYATIPQPSH